MNHALRNLTDEIERRRESDRSWFARYDGLGFGILRAIVNDVRRPLEIAGVIFLLAILKAHYVLPAGPHKSISEMARETCTAHGLDYFAWQTDGRKWHFHCIKFVDEPEGGKP